MGVTGAASVGMTGVASVGMRGVAGAGMTGVAIAGVTGMLPRVVRGNREAARYARVRPYSSGWGISNVSPRWRMVSDVMPLSVVIASTVVSYSSAMA